MVCGGAVVVVGAAVEAGWMGGTAEEESMVVGIPDIGSDIGTKLL